MAAIIVQLAGIGVGSGDRGIKEVEKTIGGARLEKMAKELYKAGEQRSCFEWFATALFVLPSGRTILADFVEQTKR